MLRTSLFRTAISIGCLLTMSVIASADTKVKSRQTSGGQTYENTSYIKGKRQRSETSGGQMIMIQQCDLRRNIQIMPAAKVYMIQPYDDGTTSTANNTARPNTTTPQPVTKGGVVTSLVTTKDTGERKQILGYTARHIITTMEMKSSPDACSQVNTKMQIDGWYIDATFALDCDSSRAYSGYKPQASGGCRDRYETKQVGLAKKGYPVYEKMTMFGPDGAESFSTVTEVVEFSNATLDPSLFEVPEGYRQVDDFSSAFSAAAMAGAGASDSSNTSSSSSMTPSTATAQPVAPAPAVGPKKAGMIRLGIATVKTGNVTEGMNANDLALAVQKTLPDQLKAPNVESIVLQGSGAALQAEAREKECDYIVYASVSLKKGGGGFGSMLGNTASIVGGNIGYGGSTAAAVTANVATATVVPAIKPKDEMTLNVRTERPGSTTPNFAKDFKGKAKTAGEDIITPVVQQASQAILASLQ